MAKQRKAAGVIPEVVKLILAQNNIAEGFPSERNKIKTLSPHPAQAQARIEKIRFTLLWYEGALKKTKHPNPMFTSRATESDISGMYNVNLGIFGL